MLKQKTRLRQTGQNSFCSVAVAVAVVIAAAVVVVVVVVVVVAVVGYITTATAITTIDYRCCW